jgi:hypothetical protein
METTVLIYYADTIDVLRYSFPVATEAVGGLVTGLINTDGVIKVEIIPPNKT